MKSSFKETYMALIGLFASAGTLLCCALPALLVFLGFGAAVAGVVSRFPFLISLSRHKAYVFILAGMLLVLAGWARSRPETKTCPADPLKAAICAKLKAVSGAVFWLSWILYLLGLVVSFVVPLFI